MKHDDAAKLMQLAAREAAEQAVAETLAAFKEAVKGLRKIGYDVTGSFSPPAAKSTSRQYGGDSSSNNDPVDLEVTFSRTRSVS